MKELIQNTQERIAEVSELRYIDENWGQLDHYSPNMPVQWPCALIDVNNGRYSDIGRDNSKDPVNRQMGGIRVEIRIANLRMGNTSMQAPQSQKDLTWSIWDVIDDVHKKLHGFSPLGNCTGLIRESHARVIREDGVQEYAVIYSAELNDV